MWIAFSSSCFPWNILLRRRLHYAYQIGFVSRYSRWKRNFLLHLVWQRNCRDTLREFTMLTKWDLQWTKHVGMLHIGCDFICRVLFSSPSPLILFGNVNSPSPRNIVLTFPPFRKRTFHVAAICDHEGISITYQMNHMKYWGYSEFASVYTDLYQLK